MLPDMMHITKGVSCATYSVLFVYSALIMHYYVCLHVCIRV
jgi:hypothetical protein